MEFLSQSRLSKFKPNKRAVPLIRIYLIHLSVLLFLNMFFNSYEELEINLITQGIGDQLLVFSDYYLKPSEMIVNGEKKCFDQKYCNCDQELNNVTIKFNVTIESCHKMFSYLENIIEIDLSKIDLSQVTSMEEMFRGCLNLKKVSFGNEIILSVNNLDQLFYNCLNILSVDLSNFDTSKVTSMQSAFYSCKNLKIIIFGNNFNTSLVNNMYQLFYGCRSLLSIDLSHFDTSLVTDMSHIFSLCNSISSLDVSKFNTSKVEIMDDMFSYCFSLTSINVSNFETSKVINMKGMFYQCFNLKYIDISNFDTSLVTNMDSMFKETFSLEYIKLPPFKNKSDSIYSWMLFNSSFNLKVCLTVIELQPIFNLNNHNFDCSDNCFPKTYKYDLKDNVCVEFCNQSEYKFDYNDICYYRCPNSTFEPDDNEYLCLNKTSDYFYYFDSNRDVFKQCFHKCKICNQGGNEASNNCIECKEGFTFLNESNPETFNNCYNICQHYYYFDEFNKYVCTENEECPTNYNKLIKEKRKCIDECKNDDYYTYEFNNTCYVQCPNGTHEIEEKKCVQNQENVETTNTMYQSEFISDKVIDCFHSCQFCFEKGNETVNNCIKCNDGFIFLNEFINNTNCYNECTHYYYFNELNQYLCTENSVCPEQYSKLIPPYKKCIDECKKDRIYKYDFKNICYEQCPNITNSTEDYICLENEFSEKIPFKCTYDNPLLILCSLINTNNNVEIYDIVKNQMLSEYSHENSKSQIIEGEDNGIYQITTEKNELNILKNEDLLDNYNFSLIDLGECESILKSEYKLNDNDTLIYLKQEKLSDKSSEKDIDIEVFEPYNKTKLNLSLCSQTNINIYVKLELSPEIQNLNEELQKLGYNMFDINDPFYTDICTPYKSSVKTDMILSDRIDDIYYNEDAQCQSNCYFSGYFLGSQYINCTCNIDKDKNVKEEEFRPEKIYESFFEVLKYSNYRILKCYKLLGNKRILTKNIGNIILIIFFIIYLICLITYFIKGINPIRTELKEIKMEEENKEDEKKKLKMKNKETKTMKKIKEEKRLKENKSIIINPKTTDKIIKKEKKENKKRKTKTKTNYPPIKKSIKNSRKSAYLVRSRKNNLVQSKSEKKLIKNSIKYEINHFQKNPINLIINPKHYSRKEKFLTKNETIKPLSLYTKNEKENTQKKFDDFELNELEYMEAAKCDKRTFIQIYISLLKREHKILFTFFIHNDHNLFYIKIWRFIFLIVSDMAMNALFFTDESMHKLYLSYGKYDFVQQIPQIVYSIIISQLLEVFLCFLSLTDRDFYKIKKIKYPKENIKKIKDIFKCANIRLIIFFVFTLLVFGIFWYIIVIFCAVYENTQIAFIKDICFSFLFSIIFQFVIYLIPSGLRIWAIRDNKIKLLCIYKLSDIIPFF